MAKDFMQSQNKRGRPATGTNTSIGVRMPDAEIAAIDAWRAKQPEPPSRPEAIRQLVRKALKGKA